MLSGQVDDQPLDNVFVSQARLLTLDDSLLIQGADRLASFYQAISSGRKRTWGSWRLLNATVVDLQAEPTVRVWYQSAIAIPGSQPLVATGCDEYMLDGTRIRQVRQVQLSLGENTNRQDAILLLRSLVTAIETGRFGLKDESLLKVIQRISGTAKPARARALEATQLTFPKRSDASAATIYRLMDSLLDDIPSLLNATSNDAPLAQEFLTEKVQLVGPLGEPLARDRAAYIRTISFSIASLKVALRTGRLVSEKEPKVKVELTKERNVRLSFQLNFKIKPLAGIPSMEGQTAGVPFHLSIVSEYVLDPDSGRITKHQLQETRINGQPTPGDMISQWLGRRHSAQEDAESLRKGLVDLVSWVRTLSKEANA
jgi:hypothetical protein